jgi:site-specific DNA-methyltransferase (adenine-specific)
MKTSELKPLEKNPFKSKGDEQIQKIADSIKSFEKMLSIRKIIIDENNEILGGNKRFFALKKLGYKNIPDEWIERVTGLTEAEKREFIVKDNSHWGSEWDYEILTEWDVDLVSWGVPECTFESEPEVLEAKEDDFDVPEGGIETDIVLGDLFEIGNHRLLCGDSTDSDSVAKLMNGEKADMVFTDPPYNVAFNGRSGKFDVIENDELSDKDFENFISEFANTLNLQNIPIKYIWCNWKFYDILKCKFNFNACIVWAKNVFGLGRGYRHQHEFCLFEGKLDDGINNESDLWEAKKDSKYIHPTQKPVELAERAFNNHKNAKNILDLFGGSGMSMVAAHQLKRRMFMQELDPKYCQVIVDRMRKLDPTLVIKKNGIVI